MTVGQLIEELKHYPLDHDVHLDISSDDENDHGNCGWEGDRVVRTVAGLREQSGYRAVAIDAEPYNAAKLEASAIQ